MSFPYHFIPLPYPFHFTHNLSFTFPLSHMTYELVANINWKAS